MKKIFYLSILLTLVWYSISCAIFIDDFLVNTENRAGWQDLCFIAAGGDGSFYITYTTDFYNGTYDTAYGYIKKYGPDGTKLLGPLQITPRGMWIPGYSGMIKVSPAGRVVVTWYLSDVPFDDPGHPYVQLFDTDLNIIKPLFRVDTLFDSLNGPEIHPLDLDMDKIGFFTIIMRTWEIDTTLYQRFDSLGNLLGGLARAETLGCANCWCTQNPRLGVSPNGRIAFALMGRIWPESYFYPVARVLDSSGLSIVHRVMVSCDWDTTYPSCGQFDDSCFVAGLWGEVAIQNNGNFMYVFSGCDGDPCSDYVFGRIFDIDGNPVTPLIKITTSYPNLFPLFPTVITDGRGGYIAAWTDSRNMVAEKWNGRRDLFLQRLDSLGNPIGINFRVNNIKSSKGYDDISFDLACDGQKVYVVWKDRRELPTWGWDVYAQVMDLDLLGTYMAGDPNFDQEITLADVIFTVNYIFKGNPLPEGDQLVADVNGDCAVSLVDVINLVNYIFKPGWPSPVACPSLGSPGTVPPQPPGCPPPAFRSSPQTPNLISGSKNPDDTAPSVEKESW